jgi:hypothetical protein
MHEVSFGKTWDAESWFYTENNVPSEVALSDMQEAYKLKVYMMMFSLTHAHSGTILIHAAKGLLPDAADDKVLCILTSQHMTIVLRCGQQLQARQDDFFCFT